MIKNNGTYESPLGAESDVVTKSLRSQLLCCAVKAHPPDMLIVDKHPAGLNNELLETLDWLKTHSPQTRIVLGLRDVLDSPATVQAEWVAESVGATLRKYYDRIWIYGHESIYKSAEALSFEPAVADLAITCGYVVTRQPRKYTRVDGATEVIAMVGGGHDGYPVLNASLNAILRLRHEYQNVILRMFAGPLMPNDEYRELRARSAEFSYVHVDRFSERMMRYLAGADAVITMGGYNSLVECVALEKPTIVIPRECPRQEQMIRAAAFERRNLVRVVRMADLEGSQLQHTLDELLRGAWRPDMPKSDLFSGYDAVLDDIRNNLDSGVPA